MRYEAILLDADETLFDFRAGEAVALGRTLAHFALPEEAAPAYRRINSACWAALERGEITQDSLRVLRFSELFREFSCAGDPREADEFYVRALSEQSILLPGALEAVQALRPLAKLAIVTNGIPFVQRGRIANSPLSDLIDAVVISGEVGAAKPNPRMIHEALRRLGGIAPCRALMVGDGLTSDIACARNAGCDACWINADGKQRPEGMPIRYEIDHIRALPALLTTSEPNLP